MSSRLAEGTQEAKLGAFESWIKDGVMKNCVLGFVGPAGTGKTTLLLHLCETQDVSASHFFKYEDKEASSVRHCLLSISKQLQQAVPEMESEEGSLNEIEDLKTLFRVALSTPLQRVSSKQRLALVVLDALDEADEREAVIEIVTELWAKEMPQWVVLLVSCRPVCNFCGVTVHEVLYESDVDFGDVHKFARKVLEPFVEGERQGEEAAKLVSRESKGFWPYACGLVDALADNQDSLALIEVCERFMDVSESVCDELYRGYFSRLLHSGFEGDRDLYKRFLSILAVSRECLDVDTFVNVLSGSENVDKVLKRASEVLVVDVNGVRFPHKTMSGFILSRTRAGEGLYVPERLGHEQLSEAFLQNRNSPVALRQLVYHLCKSKELDVLRNLLLDFDWLYAMVSSEGAAEKVTVDMNTLYNYQDFADAQVTQVIRSVEFGLRDLKDNPALLPFQLFGRIPDQSNPIFQSFENSAFSSHFPHLNHFLPTNTCLEQPRQGVERFDCAPRLSKLSVKNDILAVSSLDEGIIIWNKRTGACLRNLPIPITYIISLSIDTELLVFQELGNTFVLFVWHWCSGTLLHSLEGHLDEVNAVAISGDTIVSGSDDKTARIWNARSGTCLHILEHDHKVHFVQIEDKVLVTATKIRVYEWDLQTGACLRELRCPNESLYQWVLFEFFIALNKNIIVRANNSQIFVEDRNSGACLFTEKATADIDFVDVSADDMVLFGSVENQTLQIQTPKGQRLCNFHHHSVSNGFVTVNGNVVVAASRCGIWVWDLIHLTTLDLFDDQKQLCAIASSRNETLAFGLLDGSVVVLDVRTRQPSCVVLKGPRERVIGLGFCGDSVVCAYENGEVRVWRTPSGRVLSKFRLLESMSLKNRLTRVIQGREKGHQEKVNCVALSGNVLVSSSKDGTIRVWDVNKRVCVQVFSERFVRTGRDEDGSRIVALSVDGDLVVSVSESMSVEWSRDLVSVWNWRTGDVLHSFECDSARRVAIKGGLVVVGTQAVWNQVTGVCHIRSVEHCAATLAIWKETFWSGSREGTVYEWNKDSQGVYASKVVAAFDGNMISMDVLQVGNRLCLAVAISGRSEPALLWRDLVKK